MGIKRDTHITRLPVRGGPQLRDSLDPEAWTLCHLDREDSRPLPLWSLCDLHPGLFTVFSAVSEDSSALFWKSRKKRKGPELCGSGHHTSLTGRVARS